MRKQVAVIGAGAAGLSAAYHVRDLADVTLFESQDRVGGHANTIEVVEDGRTIGVDTAFVVFNDRTYPRLTAFFDELGVEAVDHSGGFNFYNIDTGTQFGTPELELSEDEVVARYPESFVALWRQIQRFYTEAPRDFIRKRADSSLGDYLDANGYTEEFKYSYILLVGSAAWSLPAEVMWEMPASTLIAFFMSHDPSGLGGKAIDWKTVGGGSKEYVRRTVDAIGGELRLGARITGVREEQDHVAVRTREGVRRFDYAVIATHADEALRMLDGPHPGRAYLDKVPYHATRATLHRDPGVLLPDRDRWQSWNYGGMRRDGRHEAFVVYYMNRIQGFDAREDYFVMLDSPLPVRDELVIAEIDYSHPVINREVHAIQSSIYDVLDTSRIKLCGSYFHSRRVGPDLIGSHEAAFCSGKEAAASLRSQLETTLRSA
jgi:uncharacterized protein